PCSGFSPAIRGRIDHSEQRPKRFLNALAGCSRDHQRGLLRSALKPCFLLLELLRGQGVGLVEDHDLPLVRQTVAIGDKFVANRLVRLACVLAGAVDEMQEHAAAFKVTEEAVAKSGALVSPLDQARDIRQYELPTVDSNHA